MAACRPPILGIWIVCFISFSFSGVPVLRVPVAVRASPFELRRDDGQRESLACSRNSARQRLSRATRILAGPLWQKEFCPVCRAKRISITEDKDFTTKLSHTTLGTGLARLESASSQSEAFMARIASPEVCTRWKDLHSPTRYWPRTISGRSSRLRRRTVNVRWILFRVAARAVYCAAGHGQQRR